MEVLRSKREKEVGEQGINETFSEGRPRQKGPRKFSKCLYVVIDACERSFTGGKRDRVTVARGEPRF